MVGVKTRVRKEEQQTATNIMVSNFIIKVKSTLKISWSNDLEFVYWWHFDRWEFVESGWSWAPPSVSSWSNFFDCLVTGSGRLMRLQSIFRLFEKGYVAISILDWKRTLLIWSQNSVQANVLETLGSLSETFLSLQIMIWYGLLKLLYWHWYIFSTFCIDFVMYSLVWWQSIMIWKSWTINKKTSWYKL